MEIYFKQRKITLKPGIKLKYNTYIAFESHQNKRGRGTY